MVGLQTMVPTGSRPCASRPAVDPGRCCRHVGASRTSELRLAGEPRAGSVPANASSYALRRTGRPVPTCARGSGDSGDGARATPGRRRHPVRRAGRTDRRRRAAPRACRSRRRAPCRARRSARRPGPSRAGARSRSSSGPPRAARGLLDEPLRLGVERRGRLVEDEDRRVSEDGARNRHPLLLAAREAVAALADNRLVAIGERCDQLVDLRRAGGLLDLLVRCVGPREAKVLPHGRSGTDTSPARPPRPPRRATRT